MNPGRFFMPRVSSTIGPMMGANYLPTRGNFGLIGRITNSLRTFNWSGLLNGVNRTLNVVNQTIPLVRQAGPMFNNMKSILRLAKVFGNETTNKTSLGNRNNNNSNNITNNNVIVTNDTTVSKNSNATIENEVLNSNYPNFFV